MGDALSGSPGETMRNAALSPLDAARLAALGLGVISLLGAVLFIVQPATGALATIVAAGALAWLSGRRWVTTKPGSMSPLRMC
nr:hypothetical protein [Planctomycetota bacterium]